MIGAVVAAAAWLPAAAAAADGPYEPNETAGTITSPATAARIDAGLETPQDDDWYLLHPQGVRQIQVLAVLNTPCEVSYGRVSIDVLDAEGSRSPLDSMRLGYDGNQPLGVPMTADTLAFTSQVGHRYFLHVTQSGCAGITYSLALAPSGALGTRLAPTADCSAATTTERRTRSHLKRLRTLRRKAHGSRRKQLGAKIQLQAQNVVKRQAEARARCTRTALTGYPWD